MRSSGVLTLGAIGNQGTCGMTGYRLNRARGLAVLHVVIAGRNVGVVLVRERPTTAKR